MSDLDLMNSKVFRFGLSSRPAAGVLRNSDSIFRREDYDALIRAVSFLKIEELGELPAFGAMSVAVRQVQESVIASYAG